MGKTILTTGLAAGLIAGGFCSLFALTLSHAIPTSAAMVIGYLTMLVALSLIGVAVKRERDARGAIGFWRAFGMGLAITVVASVLYALCWEATLAYMGGPDTFIDGYAAGLRRHGGDPDALAQMEAMRLNYRHLWFRLPITMTEILPAGVLVSLVAAALLRNPRFMPATRTAAS
ncbi:DUF4199 domain-containing protein [Sphingomonas sp.]|uniref:DUF4199 domain-containing protein n=1 Tax=Sphingomonas sp. TaxID=28214 RepID=UPI003CC6A13F